MTENNKSINLRPAFVNPNTIKEEWYKKLHCNPGKMEQNPSAGSMKTSSQPFFPLCFSEDFTAAKWKRQPARRRDMMTFSWMVFTKSKKQQYAECQHGDIWFPLCSCGITTGTPADITVLPRLALGLSDFSFHFNVFRSNTHFTTPWNATAASWYFDYLHKVWLNKGDSVSVTFSISL